MRNTKTTIVDFYHGAYGPTIRIDVQDLGWLKVFKSQIMQLASKSIPELDLLRTEGVEKDEISGLTLKSGVSSSLFSIPSKQSGTYSSFQWIVDAESINRIIGAIDMSMETNQSGHFYLCDEDGILVELAYKE